MAAADVTVDLQIACEASGLPVETQIAELVSSALAATEPDSAKRVELSVRVVGEDEMGRLNRDYRGRHKATNVLSFPAELEALPGLPRQDVRSLGDVVLCAPVVENEAREQGKSEMAHWQHLLVHGVLHLLGLDHIEEEDAERMEAIEIGILADLGLENPYEYRHSS